MEMNLKNAQVILTFPVLGAIATPGSYEYKERTTTGNVLPEDQRLFIARKCETCPCHQRIQLGDAFVNWAISDDARPKRDNGFKSYKAYTFWRKWNSEERLIYHIAKYAIDMGATEYEYTINLE
jgi:hypothetical protein